MTADLTVALVTLLGTMIVLIWNAIDRNRSSFEDRMSQATDFLTGSTQRRSAGIAIISASRKRLGRRREVTWRTAMVLLLCTQAIYLLEQSGQGKRPDEIVNLRRIIELLIVFNRQTSGYTEATMLAQRVKNDLHGSIKLSTGLDQAELRKMVAQSPAIDKWIRSTGMPGR